MPPATGTNEARPEVAYCPGVKEVPEELVEESQAYGDEGSEDGVDEWIQWRRLEKFLHPIEEDQEENLCLPKNLYKQLFLYLVS